ncbi:MAG: GIY-YIG nuclease family protein [Planctomycetes bacterium]|nr:GIY-YIG nuclease family protein [Planctomycetota bacterium]
MQLEIEWESPIPLRDGRKDGLIYTLDLEHIEPLPGIYVFARRWGSSFEALYVGRSKNVRSRVRGHLNNLRLMRHLDGARSGARVVFCGHPRTRPGQRLERVLAVLERAWIRHFLAEGHDLVNQQGTKIRRHEIVSTGRAPRRFLPSKTFVERLGRE